MRNVFSELTILGFLHRAFDVCSHKSLVNKADELQEPHDGTCPHEFISFQQHCELICLKIHLLN